MLSPLEALTIEVFSFKEKDAKRLVRVIEDLSLVTGMTNNEIFDFMRFGAEEEFAILKEDYNWEKFRIRLQKRLKP